MMTQELIGFQGDKQRRFSIHVSPDIANDGILVENKTETSQMVKILVCNNCIFRSVIPLIKLGTYGSIFHFKKSFYN